ncbi:MAG: hypothetical protein QGH94_13305 [Phycisphaerae bacterium]|jgi:hypothetical protein|nr:hypothetical protein [Phycisphaerae bacterium]MDP7288957.1 hypothetical protein [Phycisphaerae bacterium]
MKKLKSLLPGLVAVLAAVVVSLALIPVMIELLLCFVLATVTLALAVTRCINARGSRLRVFASTIIPAVLFVGIVCTHTPLRLAFWAYRGEFDQVACQMEAGEQPQTPFWIGPFNIRMAGRRGKIPYLASNNEPYEIDGFARHPAGQGFNLWSCITLDDTWSYIRED